jgi:ribosomal protein S18 acetylase RimI-like enzyme
MKPNEDAPDEACDVDVTVRNLNRNDLERVLRIDRQATGLERRKFMQDRADSALEESGMRVSLAAEVDGNLVGFLLASVHHGEYGRPVPVADIDTIGVDPGLKGKGVGRALMRQLVQNLRGLRVERLETNVAWDEWDLMAFLRASGFKPAPRICLELDLEC